MQYKVVYSMLWTDIFIPSVHKLNFIFFACLDRSSICTLKGARGKVCPCLPPPDGAETLSLIVYYSLVGIPVSQDSHSVFGHPSLTQLSNFFWLTQSKAFEASETHTDWCVLASIFVYNFFKDIYANISTICIFKTKPVICGFGRWPPVYAISRE